MIQFQSGTTTPLKPVPSTTPATIAQAMNWLTSPHTFSTRRRIRRGSVVRVKTTCSHTVARASIESRTRTYPTSRGQACRTKATDTVALTAHLVPTARVATISILVAVSTLHRDKQVTVHRTGRWALDRQDTRTPVVTAVISQDRMPALVRLMGLEVTTHTSAVLVASFRTAVIRWDPRIDSVPDRFRH